MRRSYVVVLFLVVVGLLAVLLRGRQETHPPLVESGDLSDGVGARVEPAVASINSALAQAEKPILAVPIQRIKVVVKRQLSELDARAWCPETRPSRFGIELVTQESPMTK
jgi:hypothetical protein